MQYKKLALCLIINCCLISTSFAKNLIPNCVNDAFKNGKPTIDFRLRYENAEQDPLEAAKATTLRSTVGFETAELWYSRLALEMVDVSSFFGQHYNPGVPELSKPNYSLINDPRGAGLTVAQLTFTGIPVTNIILGRQYINLDNQRFIGANNFRQYPQTFDAVTFSNTGINNLHIYYAYLAEVNTNISNGRTPSGRHNLNSQLFNIDWSGYQYGNVIGYAYINKDNTNNYNSNTTLGFRITTDPAKHLDFDYTLEFANQNGTHRNPSDYNAYYMLLMLSKTADFFTGIIGTETHSGNAYNDNSVFITPLGSNDNFNGLAQVFTTMPSRGLQDNFISLIAKKSIITINLTYHYFRLNKGPGSQGAGQELDLSTDIKLNEQFTLSMAYAKYNAQNNVAPDTRRIWVMLEANLL